MTDHGGFRIAYGNDSMVTGAFVLIRSLAAGKASSFLIPACWPQLVEGKMTRMPTVLRSGPYRFFFYAGDRDEPPHVHVESGDGTAKFWLEPVRLAWSHGFSAREINQIESWNAFFSG